MKKAAKLPLHVAKVYKALGAAAVQPAWDDPSSIMEVQNTRALAELEQALTETHTKPTGDPHVHDWPQTAALKLVKERSRGQPSELIEFSVSVKGGAQGASPPCNPIAVLLSSEEPWKVLGYTEWQQARDSES